MKQLLKSTFASLVLGLAVQPLQAADLAEPIVYDFSGFYFGANGGIGIFEGSVTDLNSDMFGGSGGRTYGVSDTNGTFGGQIGFNQQIDQFVLGGEADLNWAGFGNNFFGPSDAYAEARWRGFSTIRGRVGLAYDNVLFYATGGLAIVRAKYCGSDLAGAVSTPCVNDDEESFGVTKNYLGYAAGAGAEMLLGHNWTARAEYLYVDAGSDTIVYDPDGGAGMPERAKVTSHAHTFRLGVNYLFGCAAC